MANARECSTQEHDQARVPLFQYKSVQYDVRECKMSEYGDMIVGLNC